MAVAVVRALRLALAGVRVAGCGLVAEAIPRMAILRATVAGRALLGADLVGDVPATRGDDVLVVAAISVGLR